MDMNNPQMMAMAQAMMSDPEVMQMMQQPGMMEKLQGAMANPASAMGDPDVMRIIMKLQGMGGGGMGGGMGGMGGGMGMGASPSAGSAGPAGSSGDIRHLTTSSELTAVLSAAGPRLVVVDYYTSWCGPCKAIAPLFSELAARYKDKVVFVKVDGDRARELLLDQGVQGFPTFQFFVSSNKIEQFSGADQTKLRQLVEEYGEFVAPPPPCPYKHFPLKEGEAVQYADIKWELVQPKFAEISAKLASDPDATTAAAALGQTELAEIDALVGVLKQKQNYHSTTLGGPQLAALNKMLRQWPRESFGPVANLLRLAALHPSAAKFWAGESASKGGADMVSPLLLRAAQAEKPVAAMLVVRALVNGFARRALARALAARHEEVIEAVAELYKKFDDENLRLSCVALFINYAILLSEIGAEYPSAKVLLLTAVLDALQQPAQSAGPAAAGAGAAAPNSKLTYRLCVVLGTLLYGDAPAAELANDLDAAATVAAAAAQPGCKDDAPVQQVAKEIAQLLSTSQAK